MKISKYCGEYPICELEDDDNGICSGCGESAEFYEEEE